VTDTQDRPGPEGPVASSSPARSGVLRRARGVELIGEMAGSGYRVPPSLARREDGQTVQLTPLLYAVLAAVDGERGPEEIASVVSAQAGRTVSAENVKTLASEQLRPLGLVVRPDGSEPRLKRADPLLGLRFRYSVTDPERTRRLTAPFAWLFHPLVVAPLMVAFAVVAWWVFLEEGLAGAAYDAFQRPGLLLLVLGVTVLSAGFHEFGHAAAARYGGATPGVMGAGLYLVWPAFYTDVTDSYRLGRGGRIRTDLGGLYFNAIVAVGITAAWWVTGYDALLLVVATQLLQMVQQLTPLVRFDGYHVLADVTGVPDLFHRIKPTLLGALPWRWGDPEARLLKPWARVVVTTWVLVVVPMLLLALLGILLTLPRLVGSAWSRVGEEQGLLASALDAGDLLQAAARLLTMLAVVLPVAAVFYLLARLGRQAGVATWRATEGRPVRRLVAGGLALAMVAALAWVWWPRPGTYRPIGPDERGTLTDLVRPAAGLARPTTSWGDSRGQLGTAGGQGTVQAVWDNKQELPTKAEPQLALVLQPKDPGQGTGSPGAEGEEPTAWVFPFDQPLSPEPGDNQALAVATEDGSVDYDVSLALVWVEDGEAALNTNEAYAFASCETCAAVAVAFQVVLVVEDSDVVAPQNLAGAVNYDCVNCLTYALAQQLVVTLDGPLSEEARQQLDAVWAQLAQFGQEISSIPLEDVAQQLDEFEAQILQVIEADQPGTLPGPSASPGSSVSTSPTPTESATTDSTTSPSPSSSPSTSPSPTEESTTVEPTPDASPSSSTSSPSAGSSPSPSVTESPTG
jgi:putative peptide zinc metalloprotease protein